MDDFGRLIQSARLARGLTLRQLEEKTELSNPFLSQLENHPTQLSFRNAIVLSETLNLDLAFMGELFMDSRGDA